ncbi:hypothetical protein MRX96_041092 [Rhipicephalus microplus]
MKRRRLSLFTHLQDRHCNEQRSRPRTLVTRRMLPCLPSGDMPWPITTTATPRMKRSLHWPRVYGSLRPSSYGISLPIRREQDVTYGGMSSSCQQVAMSPLESSRTIAQCLLEMSRVPTPD